MGSLLEGYVNINLMDITARNPQVIHLSGEFVAMFEDFCFEIKNDLFGDIL